MNTLEAETEIKSTVQTTEAVELIDCGRVSETTQGFSFLMLYEGGIPPTDRILLF
jgi:hypothetical protein